MTKDEYLALMRFPTQWQELGMYPDAIASRQMAGYLPGHEEGAEHDRNGAFHWWLKQSPSREQLEKLVRLAALDPDPELGRDVLKYIERASAFDSELGALAKSLFEESIRSRAMAADEHGV